MNTNQHKPNQGGRSMRSSAWNSNRVRAGANIVRGKKTPSFAEIAGGRAGFGRMHNRSTPPSGGRTNGGFNSPNNGTSNPSSSKPKYTPPGQWSKRRSSQRGGEGIGSIGSPGDLKRNISASSSTKTNRSTTLEEDFIPTYDLPMQPDITPYDPPKEVKVGVTHPRGILHEMHSQHVEDFPTVPEFRMIGQDGPSHRMNFTVLCEYGLEKHRIHTQATASSKKDAKLKAAQKMVEKLRGFNVEIKIAPKCPKSSQNAIQDLKSNHMHPRGRLHEMHSTDCELFPMQPVYQRVKEPEKKNTEFELEDATGPPHNRIFTILCKFAVRVKGEVQELSSTATAESKKRAMLKASKEMLEQLKLIPEVTEWVEDLANSSKEFVPGKWFCKHCNTYMTGSQPFQAHLRGKQHQKKIHKLKLDEKEVMLKMWHRAYGNHDIPDSILNSTRGGGFGTCQLSQQVTPKKAAEPWLWPQGQTLGYSCIKEPMKRQNPAFYEETELKLNSNERAVISEFESMSSETNFMQVPTGQKAPISVDALKSLLPKSHTSVEAVDLYFRYMQKKYRAHGIVFYDTAFFKKLRMGGVQMVADYLSNKWLQKLAGIDYLIQARAVIFPIFYESKNQWMTCCLYPQPLAESGCNGLSIALYNPNVQWSSPDVPSTIYSYVSRFAQYAQRLAGQVPSAVWEWIAPPMQTLPQQRHERDSAVFAIVFAMCMATGGSISSLPSNVYMRNAVRTRAFLSLAKELCHQPIEDQWFFGGQE